jgi:hypothetical protein
MKLNPWIRRAVCEQADMEAAIAAQEAEGRVGLEREGWDTPTAKLPRTTMAEVFPDFRPDFKKERK